MPGLRGRLTWPCACGRGGPSRPPRSRTHCGSCLSSAPPPRSWPGTGPWSYWWSSLQDATSRPLSTQNKHPPSPSPPDAGAVMGVNGASLVSFHLAAAARRHYRKENQIPRATPSLNALRFVFFTLLGLQAELFENIRQKQRRLKVLLTT